MKVNLKRSWYAPDLGGLFEPKNNPIELDDEFDETRLPSTASILGEGKKEAARSPKRAVMGQPVPTPSFEEPSFKEQSDLFDKRAKK